MCSTLRSRVATQTCGCAVFLSSRSTDLVVQTEELIDHTGNRSADVRDERAFGEKAGPRVNSTC